MKVLWFTNIILPIIAKELNVTTSNNEGWLITVCQQLTKSSGIELCLAFPLDEKSRLIRGNVQGLYYYGYPRSNNPCKFIGETENAIKVLIDQYVPDIIHVWGTEFSHSLSVMRVCDSMKITDKVIISIQGLVSIYAKHYYGYLDEKVVRGYTLKEKITRRNIVFQKKEFEQRGVQEKEALILARNVIGRTEWDYACTRQINPNLLYHHCNETLREQFYSQDWELIKCQKHRIFVSQSTYPIKGLHLLLKAMPIILDSFPSAEIYVTGWNRMDNSVKAKLRLGSYDAYLKKLIIENKLESKVNFLGHLSAEEMCEQYLKANVFVMPSTIENSPNSLGEAMVLGVPCVAADVGGIKDMMTHNCEGFIYQADAYYMLAHYVCKIFSDNEYANRISAAAKAHALITHDPQKNFERLIQIYKNVSKSNYKE